MAKFPIPLCVLRHNANDLTERGIPVLASCALLLAHVDSSCLNTQMPHSIIKTHFDSSFIKCLPLENRFIGGLNDECVSQLCHIDDIQYHIWHQ